MDVNVYMVACVSKRELRENTVNNKGQNLINPWGYSIV